MEAHADEWLATSRDLQLLLRKFAPGSLQAVQRYHDYDLRGSHSQDDFYVFLD